jgi:hypothetical protein
MTSEDPIMPTPPTTELHDVHGPDRTRDDAVRQIDVRGPRFSAALTCAVLAIAYLTGSRALLGLQVAVFAVAAIAGLRWSPYGNLFRVLKRRLDLGPPPATEPEAGPRFSQLMGLLFTGAGLVALLAGAGTAGWALVLVVVALSALLATTGICVGCEVHALGQRVRSGGA